MSAVASERLIERGIGDNQPPVGSPLQERLASDYEGLVAEVEALAGRANAWPATVNNDEEQGAVGNFMKEVHKTRKNVEARRVGEKEPYLAGQRDIDGFFVPRRDRLDRIAQAIGDRGEAYLKRKAAEERRAREEEERKRREAERLAREELDRKMREAAEAERRAAEAARVAREEEDRRAREAARLAREEEDRRERAALAARREEEERRQREADNATRQKNAAMEKIARERREREEREAAEARHVRAEAERAAAEAAAKAEVDRQAAAEDARRRMDEAKAAIDAAERAEQERREAERLAAEKPADLSRTRSSGSLSTLQQGFDFEVTDWSAVDLAALRPYFPRPDIEKAIRQFVRINKAAVPLAGVRIFQTSTARYR